MLLPYLDPPDLPENVEDACLVAGGDGQLVEAPQLVQEHLTNHSSVLTYLTNESSVLPGPRYRRR